MSGEPTFVDTWGWIALGNARDSQHHRVTDLFHTLRREGTSIFTSDYVLDELVTLLFRREVHDHSVQFVDGLLSAANAGQLIIEPVTAERFAAAWKLRKRFQDKPMISFTDLSSMAIMTERGIKRVLTDDDHFLHVGLGFEKLE